MNFYIVSFLIWHLTSFGVYLSIISQNKTNVQQNQQNIIMNANFQPVASRSTVAKNIMNAF